MWGIRKDNTQHDFHEKFLRNYKQGTEHLQAALALDEKFKNKDGHVNEKIQAAEHYKQGRECFKLANEVNMMDIPAENRAETHELKDKMKRFDKSAQERIVSICNDIEKMSAKKGASTSAMNGNARTASPASQSRQVHRSLPNTSDKKCVSANPHSCSRGERCGKHGATKPATLDAATKSVLKSSNRLNARKCIQNRNEVQETKKTTAQRPGTIVTPAMAKSALLKGVDSKIGERLLDEILDNTGVTLDDVAGCDAAKRALEEAVILPALNPGLFSGLRQPVKGILLFGPPGNGKTLLAKAVAGESRQKFFNISASSLTSKWVGDAEKTIRGLFQIARNAQPAIIFIDEIDSILCERSEKDTEVSRRMKTEFLVQFDGATSSNDDRILVIGATNRPHELDDAVLRRFPKRILLGLPDENARCELIKSTLSRHNMLNGITTRDIRYIASCTHGYSNSDLVALCKEAAMVPIRSLDKRKLATADQSNLRSLRGSDFDEALTVIKPSTSCKLMEKLVEFAKRSGQA